MGSVDTTTSTIQVSSPNKGSPKPRRTMFDFEMRERKDWMHASHSTLGSHYRTYPLPFILRGIWGRGRPVKLFLGSIDH